MHINIRSIVNKIDELLSYLHVLEDKIDILCVTEHWLSENNSCILNRLEGFNVASFYGRSETARGGAFVAVRSHLSFRVRPDIERFSLEGSMECAAVEINDNTLSRPLLVITIYHPPSADTNNFLDQLDGMLRSVSREITRKHVIICGDFNIDALLDTSSKQDLHSLLISFGLTSHITSPTRVTNHSQSAIDYVISNKCNGQTKVLELGLSDHNAQLYQLSDFFKTIPKIRSYALKRIFSQEQKYWFKHSLSQIDWSSILNINLDLDDNFQAFLQILLLEFQQHFPKRMVKVNSNLNKKPWLTLGLKISLTKKREMSFKAKTSRNPSFILYYKSYVKILRKLIQISKKPVMSKK